METTNKKKTIVSGPGACGIGAEHSDNPPLTPEPELIVTVGGVEGAEKLPPPLMRTTEIIRPVATLSGGTVGAADPYSPRGGQGYREASGPL